MTDAIILGGAPLDLESLRRLYWDKPATALDLAAKGRVDDAAATVARVIEADETVYGINTGFGKLASTRIERAELDHLQANLVRSHAVGVGAPLPAQVVRLVLALKIQSLGQGASGVRWEVLKRLHTLLERDVLPVIPAQGSVGACGDLAPLAHLSLLLLGEGEAFVEGVKAPGRDALAAAELQPVALAPKEGLGLLNGTQVSTALALAGLFEIERIFRAALVTGALSVDAALGSDTPFDPRISALRGHKAQSDVAAAFRQLIEGSEIRQSHVDCGKVQDPYSLRCQPQVMGACLGLMRQAAAVLRTEANAVSDNPLVFPDTGEVLSGGNFHAEPVAFAADQLALAVAEIGALAERRVAMLTDGTISGLPPFLVKESGLNSGFMIVHVTAAALASENKQLSHPGSVDSLPTSANQEDHVSMATHAARRLLQMAENADGIVGIELLAAAQGVDFHQPLKTAPLLESCKARLRRDVAPVEADRYLAPDIEIAKRLVRSGELTAGVDAALFPVLEEA